MLAVAVAGLLVAGIVIGAANVEDWSNENGHMVPGWASCLFGLSLIILVPGALVFVFFLDDAVMPYIRRKKRSIHENLISIQA